MRPRSLAPLAAVFVLNCSPVLTTADDSGADGAAPDGLALDATARDALSSDSTTGGDTGHVPTWYGDIAPFAYGACGACHIAGGVGPFDITRWDEVIARGGGIAALTLARTMPPMPVDNSGACHTFSNARSLTDGQIALIQTWAQNGMPQGDPSLAPPPRRRPPGSPARPCTWTSVWHIRQSRPRVSPTSTAASSSIPASRPTRTSRATRCCPATRASCTT
ncbi:MAG: hypothetical protein WCJ30_02135 [Deltaproteobacteria bacterium]